MSAPKVFREIEISGKKAAVRETVQAIQALVKAECVEIYSAHLDTGFFSASASYNGLLHIPKGIVLPVLPEVTINKMRDVNHGTFTFLTKDTYQTTRDQLLELANRHVQELRLRSQFKEHKDRWADTFSLAGVIRGNLRNVLRVSDVLRNNQYGLGFDRYDLVTAYKPA